MQKRASEYIIEGGKEGKRRLNILAGVLEPYTRALLATRGVEAGKTLIDVGCGGGHVALMVAKMVENGGRVEAVDYDGEILALSREDAIAEGVNNVLFRQGSAYDINYHNEFDFAYSRFLLSHLTEPLSVLQKMLQSVKPGGQVIVEDIHFSGHFCYPACRAFDEYVRYFTTAAHNNGQDAEIGPRLVGLCKEAGLTNVEFDVIQPCFNTGQGKLMAYSTLDKIKGTLIEQGIATTATIHSMLAELDQFASSDQTIMSLPRIFRVWGQK